MAPFHIVHGYPPSLFPSVAADSAVLSALALVRRCKRTWELARKTQLRMGSSYKSAADLKRRAPAFKVGQRIWLSTKDLLLRTESCKLAPRFVGPFPITKIVNPVAVSLKLPRSMRVHPTFHVSWLRSTRPSPLVPPQPSSSPTPPPMIDGGSMYSVRRLLSSRHRGRGFNTWWIGKGMAQKNVPGSRPVLLWTPALSETSTHPILRLLNSMEPAVKGRGYCHGPAGPSPGSPDPLHACALSWTITAVYIGPGGWSGFDRSLASMLRSRTSLFLILKPCVPTSACPPTNPVSLTLLITAAHSD
ncbi:uncharacterized protein LOC133510861 [Syngnathoides biaculeatus]|uniref:uncharacterized protein LOC133510861 n=1 Tax=Syngnathoides biaculeatus TaxID=300417 RepID=UPI002ADDBC89|nr:uncharacterized protein LOC133510861 [Syngnathoides biaculeatus]